MNDKDWPGDLLPGPENEPLRKALELRGAQHNEALPGGNMLSPRTTKGILEDCEDECARLKAENRVKSASNAVLRKRNSELHLDAEELRTTIAETATWLRQTRADDSWHVVAHHRRLTNADEGAQMVLARLEEALRHD